MSDFPTKILLATDASQDAILAAKAAVDIANRTTSELYVVHVEVVMPTYAYPSIAPESYSLLLEQEARDLLAKQVEQIQNQGGRVAGTYLRVGHPVDEIVDLSEELGAGLVVIGSRGLGTIKRLVMGSISEGVVHHASCPVLVVRGGEGAWPPARIVIGDDASNDAVRAARLGASLGRLYDARVLLMRAYPKLPEMSQERRAVDARTVDDALRRAEKDLEERAAELEQILEKRPRVRVAVGDVAGAILEAAQEEDAEGTLIVVGSRGFGAIKRMRLGSVSTKVMRAAGGPVLITPPPRT